MRTNTIKFILSLIMGSGSSLCTAMEAPESPVSSQQEWAQEYKVASSAASFAYDMNREKERLGAEDFTSLQNFDIIHSRYEDAGSIQAVALYDKSENMAVVSFRGTVTAQDWQANLGIGCSIAQAIHVKDIKISDAPVRLPDYFAGLAANKLKGLLGDQQSMIDLKSLNMPIGSFLDTFVSFSPLSSKLMETYMHTGKHFAGALATGTAVGAGAGTIIPGAGTLAGGLVGGGLALAYGTAISAYNSAKLLYDGYAYLTDYKYERETHLKSLLGIVNLNTLQRYTQDSSDFLSASIEKVLSECNPDQRPTVIVTGHSLARFLSGYAFLDYAGAQSATETGIQVDGLARFSNIGFNGPAGFQGLPHLSFMTGQKAQDHIVQALTLIETSASESMQHVRRLNDLVGHLGNELDFAQIHELPDVENSQNAAAQVHFLENHGVRAIMSHMHN